MDAGQQPQLGLGGGSGTGSSSSLTGAPMRMGADEDSSAAAASTAPGTFDAMASTAAIGLPAFLDESGQTGSTQGEGSAQDLAAALAQSSGSLLGFDAPPPPHGQLQHNGPHGIDLSAVDAASASSLLPFPSDATQPGSDTQSGSSSTSSPFDVEQAQRAGLASLSHGNLMPDGMAVMPPSSHPFAAALNPMGQNTMPFTPAQTLALIANVNNADGSGPFGGPAMGPGGPLLQGPAPQMMGGHASTTTTAMPPAPALGDDTLDKSSTEMGKPAKTRTGSSVGGSTAGSTRRAKFRRSRTGCLVCRKRKVKCDQDGLPCKQCRIGQRDCHYEETPPKRRRKGKAGSQDALSDEGSIRPTSSSQRRRQSNTAASEISRASSFGSGDRKSIVSELSQSSFDASAGMGGMPFPQMGLPFELTAPDALDSRRVDEKELFSAHTHLDDLSDSEQMRSLGQARRLSDDAEPERSEGSTVRSSTDDDVSLAYTHDSDSRDSLGQWTTASSVFTSMSGPDDWSLGAIKAPESAALPLSHGHNLSDMGTEGQPLDAGPPSQHTLHSARYGDLSGASGDTTLGAFNITDTLLPGGHGMDVGGDLSKLTWSPQIMTNNAPPGSDTPGDPTAMTFSQPPFNGPLPF